MEPSPSGVIGVLIDFLGFSSSKVYSYLNPFISLPVSMALTPELSS